MGRLIYGPRIDVEVDDNVLANLDFVINRLRGVHFSVQITGLGGAHDGNLLSLHCGPGIPVALEYLNTDDINIDVGAVSAAEQDARSVGVFGLNHFPRGSREILDRP